jgi:glycerol uptake facilitator-like aquaporin
MVDQASVNNPDWPGSQPYRREASAAAKVRDGVGELLHDVVSLSELQAQLLAVDAKESVERAKLPIGLLVGGIALALGAVPVLLLSLGEALTLWLDWERALSYLVSGLAGAVIAGVLLYLAMQKAGAVIAVFDRSRVELAENVRWIKYALTRGRRPPR